VGSGGSQDKQNMSTTIDYSTIAIITIFTSFFAGLGQELAREIIQRLRQGSKKLKEKTLVKET
jgi:hypothetical protein